MEPLIPQIAQADGRFEAEGASKPAKSWWRQLLFPDPPDPRHAPRETLPGLAAYFWTGGVPVQHAILDVSPTGLFVQTEERWYPGTVVRMTLIDSSEPAARRSITVNTRVIRAGEDGVGLQVLLESAHDIGRGHVPQIEGLANSVDQRQFDAFLAQIRDAAKNTAGGKDQAAGLIK
jgi:hypothetical protein